MIFSFI